MDERQRQEKRDWSFLITPNLSLNATQLFTHRVEVEYPRPKPQQSNAFRYEWAVSKISLVTSGLFCIFATMPLPKPNKGEKQKNFILRCMSELSSEFPDQRQRYAVCQTQLRKK